MIAWARADPTPGSLSSSSALAGLISTSSPAFSGLAVVLGAAAAGGEGGDLAGGVVCAAAGSTRSTANPIAAKMLFSLIA
jgi:hypothetical protein